MKIGPTHIRLAALAAVVFLVVPSSLSAKDEAYEGTGFLSNYSKLGLDPEKHSDWFYRNPDLSLQTVTGLSLESIVFYFPPSDEGQTLSAEKAAKMAELGQRFDETLRQALVEEGIVLFDEAGPGVIKCRMAITNLGRTKSAARVLPQARLLGVGRGGATMEGECIDSVSGEVVYQVVNTDKGKRKSGVNPWSGAESAIRKWANRLDCPSF